MNLMGHGRTQTDTDGEKLLYADLTYKIIGMAIELRKELGQGFLEKVYENSLMILLQESGLTAVQQPPITVLFREHEVGHYVPDILVEDKIILELKSVECIGDAHRAQMLNYLKATGKRVGLILNFGKDRMDYERLVL